MIGISRSIYRGANKLFDMIIPSFIKDRVDFESAEITRFMVFAGKNTKKSDLVLDAGAGTCPYKKHFSHAKYESTDFEDIFDEGSKTRQDFICSLDDIPRPDSSYDVIINTQVLEHVEYPQKVVDEFYRILSPGGKLFMTVPLGWKLHRPPYHFYNFTRYGLLSLFRNSGFDVVFIRPRGGVFAYLGAAIQVMPSYIYFQYILEEKGKSLKMRIRPSGVLLLPFYIISLPICQFIIPFIFYYLDKLDKKKEFTLGYQCYCTKPKDGKR